jgi:hypothetical protein
MGSIIAFDTNSRKKIREIIEFSFKNIIPLTELRKEGKLKKGEDLPLPGDKENHTITVPEGFKIVYSVENQGDNENQLGLCKHISMSTDIPGELPHPLAIQMAMLEFGFENKLYETFFWPEEFGGNTQIAINVLEPINGWPKEIESEIKEKNMQIFSPKTITDIDSLCEQALGAKT